MKVLGSLVLVAAVMSFGDVLVEAVTTPVHGVHVHHREVAAHLSGSAARLARRKASGKCQAHFSQLSSSTASTKTIPTSSSKAKSTAASTHTTLSTHTTTSTHTTSTHTTVSTYTSSSTHTTSPAQTTHTTLSTTHTTSTSTHAYQLAATPVKAAGSQSHGNGNGPATYHGLIQVESSQCGGSDATTDVTVKSGPNGAQSWLNCGVTGGGWNPPPVKVTDLRVASLADSVKSSNSPFQPCTDFIDIFYQYAGEFGLPPILLAGIAMQESTCNPNTVGGAGEQGLMQLTPDKCGGAPGGNCKEPHFNIRTGAAFFASLLEQNGGNVLLSMGNYNGWNRGMTVGSATAIADKCCRCQNNLDYLQQYFNGWLQGVDPYTMGLGTFKNLDACPWG